MVNAFDHLWAGWRSQYVSSIFEDRHAETGKDTSEDDKSGDKPCVFCALMASEAPPNETNIVWRSDEVVAILNAYPYGTGHVLILPARHLGELEELTESEASGLWDAVRKCAATIRSVYESDGMNIGFNLGEGSGAGIPGHLHCHVLPRWKSDTNFITSVANAKVLPESLDTTWAKISSAWNA